MSDQLKQAAESSGTANEELMESIREKQGYKELEGKLRRIVRTQELIPRIKLFKMRDKLSQLRHEKERQEFYDELEFQLVNEFLQLVSDADRKELESEELVFTMMMMEDIAKKLVREYIEEHLPG